MEKKEVIEAIVNFLANRSIDAFKSLYHYYYKSLCFFANDYLNDENQIEDVVQDVFTQVWETPPRLQDASKLQAYLYVMVRNKCLNLLRGEQHMGKYIEHELHEGALENYESLRIIKAEVLREIMDSIEKLPRRAREVFELSYLTQLREQDIAERLNISLNSVKTHKQRAKAILKNELKHLFSLLMIFHL